MREDVFAIRPASISGATGSLLVSVTTVLYLVIINVQGNVDTRRAPYGRSRLGRLRHSGLLGRGLANRGCGASSWRPLPERSSGWVSSEFSRKGYALRSTDAAAPLRQRLTC
jgi:hypothetical protein